MKPELIEKFYPNGNLRYQAWFLNGELHKKEGPAVIGYHENGNLWYQEWRLNGKLHKEEGPAFIRYHENGNVKLKEWWLTGKELSKKDFTSLDMIRKINAFELFSPLEIARFKI
jgi:antitoxin component YwqK of YwqJK toxin-antitoxin module